MLKKKQGIKPIEKKETVEPSAGKAGVKPVSGEVDEVQAVHMYKCVVKPSM